MQSCIMDLQANKTEGSISRVAQALGTLHPVVHKFDADNNVRSPTTTHRKVDHTKDLKMVVELL